MRYTPETANTSCLLLKPGKLYAHCFLHPNTPVTVDLNNTLKAIIERKETSQAIFQAIELSQ